MSRRPNTRSTGRRKRRVRPNRPRRAPGSPRAGSPAPSEKLAPGTGTIAPRRFEPDPPRVSEDFRAVTAARSGQRAASLHDYLAMGIALLVGAATACLVLAAGGLLPALVAPRPFAPRLVAAGILVALALGMRTPGRTILWGFRRIWRAQAPDRASRGVTRLMLRVNAPDARLLWTSLSVVLLLAGLGMLLVRSQLRLALPVYTSLHTHFVWSSLPLYMLHIVLAIVMLLPQGLLVGTLISLVHRLLDQRRGATLWLFLVGALVGVLSMSLVSVDTGILPLAAAALLLLGAIVSAGVASSPALEANDEQSTFARIALPAYSDGRRRWLTVGIVGPPCAAVWMIATMTRWPVPGEILILSVGAALLAVLTCQFVLLGRDDTISNAPVRCGWGCGVGAALAILAALVSGRAAHASGTMSGALVALIAAGLSATGIDLLQMRRSYLSGAAHSDAVDRRMLVRGFLLAALVIGVLEPLWARVANTRLELMLPPVMLMSIAGVIAALVRSESAWPARIAALRARARLLHWRRA